MVRSAPEDEPASADDLDEVLGDRGLEGSPTGGRRGRTRSRRVKERPVRPWRPTDDLDDELDRLASDRERKGRPPAHLRARDSMFFEPLVALAIIVVLLVSLFAYTSNWPPVYVVESNSMQHGAGDHLGFLNAGDVVLAQKVSNTSVQPYFPSVLTGFKTYGEFGDVILYYPNGSTSATPIVHRAITFLVWDAASQTYSAPGLRALPCNATSHPYYRTTSTASGCGTTGLNGILYLYNLGWKDTTITVDFTSNSCRGDLGAHSGFLTLGDNNSYADQVPAACGTTAISSLVEPGWVIGVARGLLPWFGALKLVLDGNAGHVPGASWEYMGLSIAGLLLAAAGIHLLLRRRERGVDDRRRREQRRDAELGLEDESGEPPARPAVRRWEEPPAEEEAPEPRPAPRASYEERRRSHFVSRSGSNRPHGRPEPPPAPDETESS